MALLRLQLDPPRRDLRQFAAIWFPAFAAVAGLLAWHLSHQLLPAGIIWGVGGAWALLGAFRPPAIRPAWVMLMLAAYPVGFVVSWVALGLVYYLVLTPTGLLMRLFGRDPLVLRPDPQTDSFWERREVVTDKARYFRQF